MFRVRDPNGWLREPAELFAARDRELCVGLGELSFDCLGERLRDLTMGGDEAVRESFDE